MQGNSFPLLGMLLGTALATAAKPPLSFFKPGDVPMADRLVVGSALGDFNNDGFLDLVVSTPSDGTIHVALSDRRGRFGAAANYSVSPGRGSVALADFNNDGNLDIVVASGIAVLLGFGDGTFQSPMFSPGSATNVVVADFDRDGTMDIAAVGKNSTAIVPETVDVYRGLGDGTFGPFHTVYTSDNAPRPLAVGDFDGDDWPDLAFTELNTRALHVFLNNRDLTFTRASSTFTEVSPASVVAGDIDANGTIDVATANGLGNVSMFLGNGNGTLQERQNFSVASGPCSGSGCPTARAVSLADFDLDGLVDLLVPTNNSGIAVILLNNGGSLAAPQALPVRTFSEAALHGDVDNDGAPDVVVINSDADFQTIGTRFATTFLNKAKAR